MKKIIALISVLTLGLLACSKNTSSKGIEIVGSDTLLELVQAQGEAFVKKTKISVNVTGGGSGVGIAKILDGVIDIANASRAMKSKELVKAKKKGLDIKEVKLAIDAIAVIVNPGNPVSNLSAAQLEAIYKGEVTNWKEVGGPDVPVSLYGRQSSSGTFAYFRKKVLHKKDYSDKMKRMNGNAQIVAAVKADKGGIGYVGIGYVASGKTGVKMMGVNGVLPNDKEKVLAGKYYISRYLYQYINGVPKGNQKKFLQFALSEEGQKIVEETGFYPLGAVKAKELNPFVF